MIGVDVVSIDRMHRILHHVLEAQAPQNMRMFQGVLRSVFTVQEIVTCLASPLPVPCFARLYSGKEAFFKALGTGVKGRFLMSDISFQMCRFPKWRVVTGSPTHEYLCVHNFHIQYVSFASCSNYIVAVVVVEPRR